METVWGVDPGKQGAIVAIGPLGGLDGWTFTWPMPVIRGKNRADYDIPKIRAIFGEGPLRGGALESRVFIERQQPMPAKMGGSLASYWRGAGQYLFEGMLCAMGIPYEIVPPQTWQKEFFAGLSKDLGKQRSVIVCKRLFPAAGDNLKRTPKCKKDDDGIADAILIAEWGRRHLGLAASGGK